MQKMQCWAMVGTVVAASLALANAAGALPMQLDYFCYQQKVTGQVRDLTKACQSTPIQKNAPESPTSPNKKPNGGKKLVAVESGARRILEFSDLNYEGNVLVGFARNKTGKPIRAVSISYVVLKRESETRWKPVYSDSTRTQANSLKAGEKTTFTATSPIDGDKIVITKAEF